MEDYFGLVDVTGTMGMNTDKLFLSCWVVVTMGIWAAVTDLSGIAPDGAGWSVWLTVETVAVFEIFV